MARSMRLQGAWTLALLLMALAVVSSLPSTEAQTTNTTANATANAPSPAKAPAPSPKKAPAPAPKKAPPPPPYYPPSQYRKNAVYGLTFGGIGLCLAILLSVLVYDFIKKDGYFKRKEQATTQVLLNKGDFTTEDAQKVEGSPPRRYS